MAETPAQKQKRLREEALMANYNARFLEKRGDVNTGQGWPGSTPPKPKVKAPLSPYQRIIQALGGQP
jgi:hypothetical protein